MGFVSWLVYAWRRTGTPIAFVTVQRDWDQAHFTWFKEPFVSVSHLFGGYGSFKAAADVLATAAVVFIVSGLGMLLWAQLKKVPIPLFWWAFAVGGVLVAFSGYWQSATLRLALVLIPLMAAFAWRIRPSWTGAVVGSMALAQELLGHRDHLRRPGAPAGHAALAVARLGSAPAQLSPAQPGSARAPATWST